MTLNPKSKPAGLSFDWKELSSFVKTCNKFPPVHEISDKISFKSTMFKFEISESINGD